MPAKLGEYTYSAQRMAGTPTLTATLNYPSCLDDLWTGEEFVEFRGEKYYVDQVPTSSKDNKSIMYKHELQFVSERIVLENVYFMDVVTDGADTYHSNSTSVKFMGDINEFVGRLNASMTKSGIGYSVVIDDDIISDSKLVSLDNVYLADALQSIYTIYELPYYFVGKVCHIGYTENVISTPFEYRKGLISIKKTNANYKIVNRVTGVGSSDNIPFYYPNDDEKGAIERSQNLMPSIYRESGGAERFYNALNNKYKIPGTNDYYSFKNTYSTKKVKEIKVDFSDIKPTIEGVTNASGKLFGEIADIAFDENDSDELGTGKGNNVFNGTDEYVHSYFYIKLHIYNGDYGFNLFEQGLEGGTAVINMTTGNCAACEFEIGVTYKKGEKRAYNPVLVDSNGNLPAGNFEQKVTSQTSQYVDSQQNTSKNEVWIAVKKDNTSFGVVMPNATNNYKPSVGDKFVITGIKMPKPLVIAAEKRLEEALIKYMHENNDEKFTFSVNFSRVFLADNSHLADILNENARIYIKYNNREYLMYVNSFTCKADKNCLYDISIELTDKLSANVSALRSTISEIAGDIIGSKLGNASGGFGTFDIISKTSQYYLRKDIDDTARGRIFFDKKIGSSIFIDGWEGKGWEIPDTGAAILDSLRVRSDIYVGGRIGSPSFISGFPEGTGWDLSPYTRTNAAGVKETRYRLEIDDIVARKSARFYEMIMSQLRGENDNVMFSGQMKVAYYDSVTGRLYLDTELGILYNPFRPGDLLEVQRYNGMPSSDNDYYITKQYELQVEEVGIGSIADGEDRLDWITFKNFVGNLSQIAEGDVLTRVDSATDSTRKGIVKITTIDELGTPHISAIYGMKTNPDDSLLARLGNCAGVRTKNGTQLTEQVGLYARGAFFENSTIVLQNGDTIDQTFIAMNGKFESLINGIRNDISAEGGNILVNSSFSQNTNYWIATNNVHFINVGGEYLWLDGSFYVEKDQIADIYNDNGHNVLRIRNTYILQQNSVMNVPEHEEGEEHTYSFSLFYRVLRPGSCGFGIPGTDLYHEEQLSESDSYQKLSKVGKWDGKGDFELRFTGEILIYGVGLLSDELADTIVKLQTQIDQTDEYIKLLATKDYVDSENEQVYIHYDSQLQITAEQMSGISTKVDNINHTIESAGWITSAEGATMFAKKEMEGGKAIVNAINVGTDGILIQANRVNLVGAVSFSMFDYSLQSTINGKANSSSLGNLAYEDYVAASDLSYSLAQTIANKVSANALKNFALADGSDITKGDLENALQTEINNKLTGSATASGNKLANVIINGQTLIAGGYIQAELINVDELYATSLAAVRGSVGGWYIGEQYLSNSSDGGIGGVVSSSSFDMYSKTRPGYNFLHMNPNSDTILAIRADDKTGLSIYSQSPTGICLRLSAQAGSAAISASGGASWFQRKDETWNMPGILGVAYYVTGNTSGSMTKVWGEGIVWGRCTRNGTGNYTIAFTRNGNTDIDYMPIIGGYNNFLGSFCITQKSSSTSFTFQAVDTDGKSHDASFYVVMVGRNRLI